MYTAVIFLSLPSGSESESPTSLTRSAVHIAAASKDGTLKFGAARFLLLHLSPTTNSINSQVRLNSIIHAPTELYIDNRSLFFDLTRLLRRRLKPNGQSQFFEWGGKDISFIIDRRLVSA